jgi:chorismate mutase / prephenate dehydratase
LLGSGAKPRLSRAVCARRGGCYDLSPMPDPTSPAPQTIETPSPEGGWRRDLASLRARLDGIDDKIHDLLMQRAVVIEDVARSGKTAAFRPGREASILRRLLARHTGKLPGRTLVRMWREMLAGTTAMQAPFTVAAYDPTPDRAVTAIAREHFGFLTPVLGHATCEDALDALRSEAATIAVLPFPAGGAAWWQALTERAPRLHIVARLPYWADRPDNVPDTDALVVGTTPPDASGFDRTFILLARTRDAEALAKAGLAPRATHGTVMEVEGMIAEEAPGLPVGAIVLGGYAVPVAGDHA